MSLVLRGISKSFGGAKALIDVNLSVSSGSVLAIVGPNGSGKSTLLDIISGIQQPDPSALLALTLGDASLAGRSVRDIARLGVRRTFQRTILPSLLTVAELLTLAVAPHRGDSVEEGCWRESRVRELLEEFKLAESRSTRVGDLSVGTRRLVSIACALADRDARLVLLDEPFGSLAAGMRAITRLAIRRCADRGRIVCVVEQDQRTAIGISDQVLVLISGRAAFLGSSGTGLSEALARLQDSHE